MGRRNFSAANVICPFFSGQDVQAIRCEGPARRCTISVRFVAAPDKRDYMRKYCESMEGYPRCPVCAGLTQKWRGLL